MSDDHLVLIDDHTVVACSPADAAAHLADPEMIAAWFGARHEHDRTVIATATGRLELHRNREDWRPAQRSLMVDGTVAGMPCHAHLTLRGVIRPRAGNLLHEATEIWVHVELGPGPHPHQFAPTIRAVVRRGLEHLHLELDTEANTTDRHH